MHIQLKKILIALIQSIFLLLTLFSNAPAFASHQVGAVVYWTRSSSDELGNITVNFDVYFALESFSSFNENFVSTLSSVSGQLSTFAIQLQEAKTVVKSKGIKKKINDLILKLQILNSQSFGILGKLPTGNSSCS